MSTPQLIQWLRNNSSGVYRPSAEAADLIERLSTREHDLTAALKELCEATEKQCEGNGGKESIIVRMKRNNAKKILAKYALA